MKANESINEGNGSKNKNRTEKGGNREAEQKSIGHEDGVKEEIKPWLAWPSTLSAGLRRQGYQFHSLSGHKPGLGPSPQVGLCERQLTHVSLSH